MRAVPPPKGPLALAASLLAALALAAPVLAQTDYPNKPVRIINPFVAGSTTDVLARALGAGLALQVEDFRQRRGRRARPRRPGLPAIGAICERGQHLPGVLEIAFPQQRDALAGVPVSLVRGQAVIDDDDALRGLGPAFGTPAHCAGFALLDPVHARCGGHRNQKVSSGRR